MSLLQFDSSQSAALFAPDFRLLFEGAPAALLVVLPDDPVFTIVAVSNAYLRATGATRETIIGRGVFEVFPNNPDDLTANGVQSLLASFRRALATRIPDRMPLQRYDVERRTAEGGFEEHYWNPLNTPVLGEDGTVKYLLHAVEDATEKVRADAAAQTAALQLQTSEKRFRQLAEATGFGLVIADLENNFSYLNPTVLQLLGYREEEAATGLVRWDRLTPPEFAARDAEAWQEILVTGRCAPYEKAYIAKDGRRIPILIAASLLESVDGRTEVAAIILDLTERKQSKWDAFLVRLDDAARSLVDPNEIAQTAARLLGEHLRADRCVYCTFEPDQETFYFTTDYARSGVPSVTGRYSLTQFGAETARLMRTNLPQVVDDVGSDSVTAQEQDRYRQAGIYAHLSVPLHKAGQLVAAIGVHQQFPRKWLPEEVELVKLVSNRCWEAIERARVSRELQQSERRLRLSQKAGRLGSFEWLMKENKVIWTPETEALYGVAEGTFEGSLDGWSKRVVAEDAERVIAGVESCLARHQAEYTYEFRAVLPDGTQRWLRGQAQFFYDGAGAAERMIGVNIDIDAQKQTEAHLQQQWQAFDTALSHTPDFIYTFDLQGRFTYVNRALLALWQRSLEDVIGKDCFELDYPPELAKRVQRQVQQVIDTKQPLRDETPFTGATGKIGHYEYIFAPVLAANGQVEAVAGSTRDTTERNKAAELVQQDRRRWRELLLKAPAAIAVLQGPEHRYEWVNDDYLRLVGRASEAMVGRAVREAVPEIISQGYASMFDRVYQTGEPYVAREALVMLGEVVPQETYLNFVCLPTRNSDGEIDGTFVHVTDVTDLVKTRQRIEESERQFRTLAESIPNLACMADETGNIFWYNQRWYAYTGTTFEDMQGWGWQKVHDPAVLPTVLTKWKEAISSGESFEMVFPLKRSDGAFRSFLTRVEPVKDQQGRVVRWFGTNTDIADQKKVEEELRRANRELEEFAYVASHDLQEPLRMVNIYTQMILRRLGGENAALNQYGDFVRQGVARMDALLRDLLTFSRTVHTEELPVGTANLSASLSEALAVLKSRIEESGASITAEPLPIVHGDAPQLAHVFQNLLSNALKYRKKKIAPKIHISARQEGGRWIISVQDNGIGFEPQYAERIFGLFKRLHKEEYPGTGLGLAICQRIVERYGGRMWAEGKPGEGASFHFSLSGMEKA